MKKMKRTGVAAAGVVIAIGALWICFGEKRSEERRVGKECL